MSAHSRRSKFSEISDLSADVKMRITGNYAKDRKICSSHNHIENSVKSDQVEVPTPTPSLPKSKKSSVKKLPGIEI